MGISRESLGQIRNILRKLDDSIDTVREKRLEDNERRQQLRNGDGAMQRDTTMLDTNGIDPTRNDPHNMSQQIG